MRTGFVVGFVPNL